MLVHEINQRMLKVFTNRIAENTFIRFSIAGGVGTVVNLTLLAILVEVYSTPTNVCIPAGNRSCHN